MLGLALWCEDEAGPYQTIPYPGHHWCEAGQPARQPHEYFRDGTAKLLTLFHPASGQVRMKGVTRSPNVILHAWLKEELTAILAALPPPLPQSTAHTRGLWQSWQAGFALPFGLGANPPPLRLLLVMDNLAGHKSVEWVNWCYQQGILILYTPLGGSWLNMAESIQRIIKRRALEGTYPRTVATIIEWFEATARGWNADPTPFVWGGRRQQRRRASRERALHRLGGSGACTRRHVQ